MSQDFITEIEENEEALQALANSDLRSSGYAQALLSMIERETSYSTTQSNQTDTEVNSEPENSTQKDSIFAY